jgi:hypothetical protein
MLGFCSRSTDGQIILNEELEKVVNELASDNSNEAGLKDSLAKKEHAVHANQWRFRSCYGVVHNSEFFFNTGSMGGDDLVRQWMHVHTCYEIIGCKIYGLCGDAGGSNASFFKMIRRHHFEPSLQQ